MCSNDGSTKETTHLACAKQELISATDIPTLVFAGRTAFSAWEESAVEGVLQECSTTIYKRSATKCRRCFPLHARSCALGFLLCMIFYPLVCKNYVHVTFFFLNSEHVKKIRSGRAYLAIKMVFILCVTDLSICHFQKAKFFIRFDCMK